MTAVHEPTPRSPGRAFVTACLVALPVLFWGCGGPDDSDPHADHGAPPDDPHAGHVMPGDAAQPAQPAAEDPWEAEVGLDPDRLTALGIVSVAAVPGTLPVGIRVTGSVEWDETRLSTVTLRYGGYVERLHVAAEGDVVREGAPLLDVHSPELVAALAELASAVRLDERLSGVARPGGVAAAPGLTEAARRRLAAWEIPDDVVETVLRTGDVPRTYTVPAPSGGVVLERLVQVGERVAPGTPLYRLAARSPVWVEARIPESHMGGIGEGDTATIELQAYPGREWSGRVGRVYPAMDPVSRTGRLRITVPNPDGELRPGMYATVSMEGRSGDPADAASVLIPRDAVIRSGLRDVVFVEEHPGHFVGREVTLGGASGDLVEVLAGLEAGERVAARGAFLLDAESRIRTGGAGMDHSQMGH
jgi:membrane fusion protein, copper/silver efflux system